MGDNSNKLSGFTQVLRDAARFVKLFFELKDRQLKWLASYGWYLSDDLKLFDIADELLSVSNRSSSEIDKRFVAYYDDIIDKKLTALAEAHPDRRHILEEALQGYKLKMYHSCVLLMLSQADGLVESDLFTSYRKKKLLEHLGGSISLFATPLLETHTIDQRSPKQKEGELNRNSAFHGLDLKYGTKTNALKAFSLLCLVADSLAK